MTLVRSLRRRLNGSRAERIKVVVGELNARGARDNDNEVREGIDRRERNSISREGKMSWTNNFNDNVVMGWIMECE